MHIKWALSQILPYRGANQSTLGKGFDCRLRDRTASTVDTTAGSREIVKEY
jgi:hypothetical protein